MAELRTYRTYRFLDKNPVIGRVQTILQDEGLFTRLNIVHELSGVADATLRNWFFGDTKNPQHATVAAVITSLGYREEFVRDHDIDIEAERKVAAAWLLRQEKYSKRRQAKKKPAKKNGHAKAAA